MLEELEELLIFRQDSPSQKQLSPAHPPAEARVKGRRWVPLAWGGSAALVLPAWAACLGNWGLLFGEGERQRGQAAGCFCLPGRVVPPTALLSGFCVQRRMPGGLLPAPSALKRMPFGYPVLFVRQNDAVNPQSRKTNPLLSSSWPR